jgi:hypothetical protein
LKKFFIGLICGVTITASTAVYASDTIKTYLFPVKYVINGESKEMDSEYTTLNYKSHTYVPIRYLAENMGATVRFNNDKQQVSIDYETSDGLNLKDGWDGDFITAGNLRLFNEGKSTRVVGQLKLKEAIKQDDQIYLSLRFYDKNGDIIGIANEGNFRMEGGQIKTFELVGEGDFTNYAVATLDSGFIKGSPGKGFPPGDLNVKDEDKNISIGDLRIIKSGDFTRINGHISIPKALDSNDYKALLSFYDETNRLIGTSSIGSIDWTISGGVRTFEAIGKGDLTKYKNVKLTVIHL